MKLGIKYCGGCNSHYDRVAFVRELLNRLPPLAVTYHPETESCDVCLLISGCPCACVSSTTVKAPKVIPVCTPDQLHAVCQILTSL